VAPQNVFQTVLFLLPGFLFLQSLDLFLPSRRDSGDFRLLLQSLASTAFIWIVFGGLLWLLGDVVSFFATLFGSPWRLDTWHSWLRPALFTSNVSGSTLVLGLAANALAVVGGTGCAAWLKSGPHPPRVFRLFSLTFDPSPSVWHTYLARPKGEGWFLVRLKSGTRLVGQVLRYSEDPNDAAQEIQLVSVSEVGEDDSLAPAHPVLTDMLIARGDIESLVHFDVGVRPPGDAG
jgi:hypothetical protein